MRKWTYKECSVVVTAIQVAVLERLSGNMVARELTSEELQEHCGAIDAAEKKLADFRQDFSPQSGDEP
jgi:hypothetical protein